MIFTGTDCVREERREQSKAAAKTSYSLFWHAFATAATRQPVDSKIDPADLSSIRFTTSGIELKRREMWEKDLQGKIKETG